MRSVNTHGGADRPTEPDGVADATWPDGLDGVAAGRPGETAGAYGAASDAGQDVGQVLTRSGIAWLAVALVGMLVTFTFGLWLAQSAQSQPMPPYDAGDPPAVSAPQQPGAQ